MTRCSATSSFVDRSFDSQRTGPLVDRRLSPSTTQLYTSISNRFLSGEFRSDFDASLPAHGANEDLGWLHSWDREILDQ